MAKTVAGVELNNNTASTKNWNAINNRDEKYEDRLEMSVHNGTYVS
jgi:hypothetical protein